MSLPKTNCAFFGSLSLQRIHAAEQCNSGLEHMLDGLEYYSGCAQLAVDPFKTLLVPSCCATFEKRHVSAIRLPTTSQRRDVVENDGPARIWRR